MNAERLAKGKKPIKVDSPRRFYSAIGAALLVALFTALAVYRGAPVAHRLDQGSAVLFPSEKLHNIEKVESGTREALVIELWEGETNGVDRFK